MSISRLSDQEDPDARGGSLLHGVPSLVELPNHGYDGPSLPTRGGMLRDDVADSDRASIAVPRVRLPSGPNHQALLLVDAAAAVSPTSHLFIAFSWCRGSINDAWLAVVRLGLIPFCGASSILYLFSFVLFWESPN
jgi:hypothetical protein